jgi:branched-chain amino acid aminotransferase
MERLKTSALLYGSGIFTTLAVSNSDPFLWDKHWRRLVESSLKLGLDISEFDEASVRLALANAIEAKDVINGRARITFFDESESPMWSDSTKNKTGLSIITGAPPSVPDEYRLSVSPHRVNSTSPLTGIKSCNYLENVLAIGEARARGFHEAIRLNERDQVISGSMSNVFWLKDAMFYTSSLETGCLAGTTREFVMENLECIEVEVGISELQNADQIYLTSAGIGVVTVAEFDGRELGRDKTRITEIWPSN